MILTLIAFFFVLSFLVIVHEFGHYAVAKLGGIGVERFSVGYPPRLFGIKIGETDYCLSAIPFGGYVKMKGQEDFAENEEYQGESHDFRSKPPLIKIAVLSAGSIMNILAAVVILAFLFLANGVPVPTNRIGYVKSDTMASELGLEQYDRIISVNGKTVENVDDILLPMAMNNSITLSVQRDSELLTLKTTRKLGQDEEFGAAPYYPAKAGTVMPDSPALRAGIQPGDIVTGIDDRKIDGWYDMSSIVQAIPDRDVQITVDRNGSLLTFPIHIDAVTQPNARGENETIGRIGITQKLDTYEVGPVRAVTMAVGYTGYMITTMVDFFGKLVTGQMSSKMLGGPVMIAQLAGESAKSGIATLMGFTAFISINLGVLNMLPIPVLDGGHVFILLTEMVIRRKVSEKFKYALQQVGAILLLLLMLYITFNDIMRFDTISRLFGG